MDTESHGQARYEPDQEADNEQKIDARVLGQILAAQTMVFALPDSAHVAEFYAQALLAVPGITACRVCLGNRSIQAGRMGFDLCDECKSVPRIEGEEESFVPIVSSAQCTLVDRPDIRVIPIDSYQHHFGSFAFKVEDADAFDAYHPFLHNLSNYIAMVLENRLQQDLLQKARDELERRVEERTHDLTAANEALALSRLTALNIMQAATDSQKRAEKANMDLQREVTERIQAEEELRESNELLRAIIEAAPVAVIGLDPDGNVHNVWNPAAEKMLGWSALEVMGKFLPSVLADKEEEFPTFREWVRSGKSMHGVEVQRPRRDGTLIDYSIYASPLYDKQDQIAGNIAVLVDITENKRMTEALIAREREFRTLAEYSPDNIARYDVNCRTLYVNPTLEKTLGRPASEMLGTTPIEAGLIDKAREYQEIIVEVLKTGRQHEMDLVLPDSGEGVRYHNIRFVAERAADGKITGIQTIGRDITERKQAEEERDAHLKFFESMDQVNRAIQGANDLEQMMRDVLDVLLDVFECDRAWLVYPCDPEAATWGSPMERTRPEYPGVFAIGVELPLTPAGAEIFRILRATSGPVKYVAEEGQGAPDEMQQFLGIKSYIAMALYPRLSKPWSFGLHQCSYARHWTPDEERLFQEIARRITDALTSLLTHRIMQESEQRYRMVFESSPVSIWEEDLSQVKVFFDDLRNQGVTDIDAYFAQHPQSLQQCLELIRVIDVNRAALTLHVAANKEDLLASLANTFTAESFDTFRQELICLWNGGTEMETDAIVRTLAGDLRSVTVYFSVCPGYEETLSRVLVSLVDITERKAAENELWNSSQMLKLVLDNMPAFVFWKDRSSVYLGCNYLFAANAGLHSPEEIAGLTDLDLPWKDTEAISYRADDRMVMETGIPKLNYEETQLTAAGNVTAVRTSKVPLKDPQGTVIGVLGTFEDITERKRGEEALRDSEERYRQLVNLSPDAIGIYDEEGLFIFANPAAAQLAGAKSESELIGKSIYDFINAGLHALTRKINSEIQSIQGPTRFLEEKILRLDGSSFDAEVAGIPFRYQGHNYVQFVARDITEYKRHQREHEAIIAVSMALRQATTRTEILDSILHQSLELFEANGAVLLLTNPQTGAVIEEMGRGAVGERLVSPGASLNQGVSGWVIANRKPYLSNQANTDPLFGQPDLLGLSHCIACAPLIAKDQAIGALLIAREYNLLEQDLGLLNAIADIAANAIHRVTLHEQTEQQLHHLIALHQIDLAISANLDLEITLNVILKNVKDELEVDAASILLMNSITHTLDYAAGIGFRTTGIEQSHVRLDKGCAGQAAREYRTVACLDLKVAGELFSRSPLLIDEQFVSHYATPLVVKGQVKGVLEVFHRKSFEAEDEWVNYFETLATQAAIAIESTSLFESLQRSNMELILAYDATIEGWSRALDLRDKETEGHTQRVTDLVLRLAEKMGLSDPEKLNLRRGALLHDIGKMGIPDSVLFKPGPLTESELELMQQHPAYAYQMLSPISYLRHALDIPYCHHEKWDGSGYPRGLKGEEIPLTARMFTVVDVFDALTSDRPYRAAWPRENVLAYIQEKSGQHFDPAVAAAFLQLAAEEVF